MKTYLDTINNRVWITKGCRWNAVRRLKTQSQLSVFSISLLSIFGIAVPIIQIFINSAQCPNIDKLYTLVSILLSIFILVLSVLEGAKNHQLKAEKLQNNAINIASLSKEIDFLINKFQDCSCEDDKQQVIVEIQEYYKKYDNLIKLCPENHETEDYLLFQSQNYKHFLKAHWWAVRMSIWLRIKYYWLYCTLVIIIGLIVVRLYLSCPI